MLADVIFFLFSIGKSFELRSVISPVIKVCENPKTYQKLSRDMDINAGKVITEGTSLEALGEEIVMLIKVVTVGKKQSLNN